jgi:hypothetical protein
MKSFYCAVRTVSLNIVLCASCLKVLRDVKPVKMNRSCAIFKVLVGVKRNSAICSVLSVNVVSAGVAGGGKAHVMRPTLTGNSEGWQNGHEMNI